MRANLPRTSLTPQPLNPRLDKMIAAYATTAGAVGVALLAAAPPAQAEVVYTKTRVTIAGRSNFYHLDLNRDGIGDFSIGFCSCEPEGSALTVSSKRNVGNMVREAPTFSYAAAALMAGAPIGPKQVFKGVYGGGAMFLGFVGSYSGVPRSSGSWLGTTNRYLGLKFMIGSEVHYGWARMTVGKHFSHVVLTGYAYETIANKPIKAGQTTETPQAEAKTSPMTRTADGPSLGMLARGADAMEIWRREIWRKEEVA
jgi:hypothetical protein